MVNGTFIAIFLSFFGGISMYHSCYKNEKRKVEIV